MSNYFESFPEITYNNHLAKNITLRVKITELIGYSNYIYHTLVDGERPDTIAHDYYGSSKLAWLVLMSNLIVDPYHEWPISALKIEALLIKQYGSVSVAKSTIVHYTKNPVNYYYKKSNNLIVLDQVEYDNSASKSSYELIVDSDDFEISTNSYNTLVTGNIGTPASEYTAVYAYDFALSQNLRYQTIRLVNKKHLSQIMSALEGILNESE